MGIPNAERAAYEHAAVQLSALFTAIRQIAADGHENSENAMVAIQSLAEIGHDRAEAILGTPMEKIED